MKLSINNMPKKNRYTFQGDPQYRPKNAHKDSPEFPEPYVADKELINAVNLAIFLRRPLLLEGEAGCGKTRLAAAVAYELGLPFYRWDIGSTTTAKQGKYEYDAILRLHDVQTQKEGQKSLRDPSVPKQYRDFGALGKAFILEECPAVVLIDEIDKADVDFPNDLLAVLDTPWEFQIPETGETITATHIPIVIITSNKEKGQLPAPFLRRCLYYYLEFPSPERLREIVSRHYQLKQEQNHEVAAPPDNLVIAAIARFLDIRQAGELRKLPGTSEFLDWLEALGNFGDRAYEAQKLTSNESIPYRELLFKLRPDWHKYTPATDSPS